MNTDSLYPPHIFDPPQAEIDRILPHLDWPDRTLSVLGESVHGQGTIYDLDDRRVVKTGRAVSVNEAKAMIFVRAHTTIPIPEVYMVFKHEGLVHIVMERVDGVDLGRAQKRDANGEQSLDGGMVTAEGMRNIVEHIHRIIDEIRDLGRRFPLKEPHFGSWPDGPFCNSYFGEDPPTSPYTSYAEFHGYFLKRFAPRYSDSPMYSDLQKLVRESPQEVTPVLSHGDLADRNILVKDNRIVAVVDWETLGWYPEFWEVMGVRNSYGGQELRDATRAVFGPATAAELTYQYATACLSFPF
ncbi:kinase-like protein [Trametes sanguinea]|nr:kinase-like protein [Trametes sanguinea]